MSIVLKLKCIKFGNPPLTNLKRYFAVGQTLRLPATSRIHRCVGRIINTPPMVDKPGRNMIVPDGFFLIYHFRESHFLQISSIILNTILGVIVFMTYQQVKKEKSGVSEDEKDPVDVKTDESKLEKGFLETYIDLEQFKKNSFLSLAELNILFVIIMILFSYSVRTNIVLYSYRNGSEYLTELTGPFGLGTRVVKHSAQDVKNFPKNFLHKTELCGKKILLLNDSFVNEEEKHLFCRQNNEEE